MVDRYYITGVQLGMLKAFNQMNDPDSEQDIENILEEIEEKQYLCAAKELDELDIVNKKATEQLVKQEESIFKKW